MKRRSLWLRPCAFVLVIGIAGTAGGCALAERAEALFLRQQSAQGALANTVSEVEMAQPALAQQLYGLEDDLHSACSPLREASQRRFKGEEVGSDLEWAIVTSLQKCESTTGTVEHMVQQAEAGNLDGDLSRDIAPAGFDGR